MRHELQRWHARLRLRKDLTVPVVGLHLQESSTQCHVHIGWSMSVNDRKAPVSTPRQHASAARARYLFTRHLANNDNRENSQL